MPRLGDISSDNNVLVTKADVEGVLTGEISSHTHASDATKLNTSAFSGLTKITVGTNEPTSPSVGDLWVDTN